MRIKYKRNLFMGEKTTMNEKLFSVRLALDEYHALKAMAKLEVRTCNSWLRSRIVKEARELNLLDDGQEEVNHEGMPQEDIPIEDIPVEYYTPPAYEELDL
jgi:hypothetical protein